jgi:hypothetical protein
LRGCRAGQTHATRANDAAFGARHMSGVQQGAAAEAACRRTSARGLCRPSAPAALSRK